MEVSLPIPEGSQIIEKYGDGRFQISGQYHDGSVFVMPEKTRKWQVSDFSELTEESFDSFVELAGEIEVLLVGCGGKVEFLSPAFRQRLRDKGLVIEAMATGAACRTYNVLLSEGRKVAAALIAIS